MCVCAQGKTGGGTVKRVSLSMGAILTPFIHFHSPLPKTTPGALGHAGPERGLPPGALPPRRGDQPAGTVRSLSALCMLV